MRIDFDVSQMDAKEAKEALLKLELRKTQLELAKKARDSYMWYVLVNWFLVMGLQVVMPGTPSRGFQFVVIRYLSPPYHVV